MIAEFGKTTLTGLIHEVSAIPGKGICFVQSGDTDEFYSYSEIYQRALSVAHFLAAKGIAPGNELVFQLRDNKEFIVAFWACMISGIIPVPLSTGITPEQKQKAGNVWKLLNQPFLLTNRRTTGAHSFSAGNDRTCYFEDVDFAEKLVPSYQPSEDDIAFIQFSSGSTGVPKGVTLTHKNLLANIRAIHNGIKSPESGDIFCSWMPLTHDMGLIGFHLTPLFRHWTHYIIPTELFIRNPNIWLRKIHQYRVTFTSSPNFGYRYTLKHFDRHDIRELDLSSLRTIVNGAEPISEAVCREFTEKFEPYGLRPTAIFPVYGLAEASLAVTFSAIGESVKTFYADRAFLDTGDRVKKAADETNALSFVNVGSPVEGCSVQITGSNNDVLEDGYIGEIRIKGDNVTSGYYNNPDATGKVISGGWLSTGDLGFFQDGSLYITGRKKDVLFIHGQNFYAHDMEREAESVPGIEPGKIAVAGGFSEAAQQEQVVAFVLFKGKIENFVPTCRQLNQLLSETFGFQPDAIVPVREIAKTTSGKIQRYLMLSRFRDGAYDKDLQELKKLLGQDKANRELPSNAAEEKLLELWTLVLGHDDFGTTDKFLHIGGNSLKAARIAALVAQHLQVNIAPDLLFREKTIRRIAAAIDRLPKSGHGTIRPKADPRPYYPLTAIQKRLFYTWSLDTTSVAYNVPLAFEIHVVVDRERLEYALREVVKRHDSLRSYFSGEGEAALQSFADNTDLVAGYAEVNEDQLPAYLRASVQPFDLQSPGLFRARLIKVRENHFILFLDFHHIIADGISTQLIAGEIFRIYQGENPESPALNFSDYVSWPPEENNAEENQSQEKFWLSVLADELPVLNLPLSYPRPAVYSYSGCKTRVALFPGASAALHQLMRQHDVSLFALTYTIYTVLLSKLCNQEDLVVGVPVSGRYLPETENMTGMFVNNLALRSKPSGEKVFVNYLLEQNEFLMDAFLNQSYDFGRLMEKLGSRRDVSRNPVFDTMFLFQDVLFEAPAGLPVLPLFFDPGFSKYDLSLEVINRNGELDFYFEYNTSLFQPELIDQLSVQLNTLVKTIAVQPSLKIHQLQLLTAEEKAKLAAAQSGPVVHLPGTTIDAMIETIAQVSPERIATVFAGSGQAYGEINRRANLLARHLLSRGMKRGDRVCIRMDRSTELVTGILAVLKCGGCFVPVDSSLPGERVNYIVDDCGARLILSSTRTREYKPGINIVAVDEILSADTSPCGEIERLHGPEDLAYIIYTSGTTGRPKGVMITHRSLVNYVVWAADAYVKNQPAVFPLFTSVSFDLTITSLFVPLVCGGTIRIYEEDDAVALLEKILSDDSVDVIKLTPSHLKLLSGLRTKRERTRLRTLIVGGEDLAAGLAKNALEQLGKNVMIYNEYGPTEATVGCMIHAYDPQQDHGHSVPIGVPATNTRIYLLDAYLNPVPAGVEGELYVAGEGLAKGYINQPALTAERFVPDPFAEGAVMYRTGDVAKRLFTGAIEYTGRKDHQVKINGYRIELNEIVAQLRSYPSVSDAIVTVRADENGQKNLCAYITSNTKTDISALRNELSGILPAYMVPAFIIGLEQFPLTRNGKTDLAALPDPLLSVRTDGQELPANDVEALLLQVWQAVLKIKSIGTGDNFFQLGGDSIKAMQITSRLHNLGYAVGIKDIFRCPTIQRLAGYVQTHSLPQYEQGIVAGEFNLPPIAYWFFGRQFPVEEHYNQSVVLECSPAIDLDMLERSFDAVLKHHDGLRLNYDAVQKKLFYNPAHLEKPFSIGISRVEREEAERALKETGTQLKSSFDLANGLLLKAAVIIAGNRAFLLITAHHLVIDGVSWRILLQDIHSSYQSLQSSQPVILPLKTASLLDWSGWLAERKADEEELAYWNEVIRITDGGSSVQQPLALEMNDRSVSRFELEPGKTASLRAQAANRQDVSVETILLSAFVKALAGVLNKDQCVIELEHHGRMEEQINLGRTVGWFTSMFPVILSANEKTAWDRVRFVSARVNEVPSHGAGYGLFCQRNGRDAACNADARFNYLGEFDFSEMQDLFRLVDADTGPDCALANPMTTGLELVAMIHNARLTIELVSNTKVRTVGELAAIQRAMVNEIDAILGSTGESPGINAADFTTVMLSQEELDQLFL